MPFGPFMMKNSKKVVINYIPSIAEDYEDNDNIDIVKATEVLNKEKRSLSNAQVIKSEIDKLLKVWKSRGNRWQGDEYSKYKELQIKLKDLGGRL